MELFWLLLVAVVTINSCNAKNIIDNISEKEVNKSTIPKVLRPHVIAIRRNSSILPNMPERRGKMVVNLKPTMKNENQTTKTEKNKNRLMKNLQIKLIDYNVNAKLPAEITTRRSLMQIKKFTVRPHDVYRESVREKYNWNSNRKISTYNSRKPKSERYTTEKNNKSRNEEESSEQKFLNFKNIDSSINENDSKELGTEEQKNKYIAAGSQKSKTIVFFPKERKTKYLKVDPEQKTSKTTDENKFDLENKTSSDVIYNQNGITTDDKEKSMNTDKVLIKSELKNGSTDQEKTNLGEIMINTDVKKSDVSFVGTNIILTSPANVVGSINMSTHSDLDFVMT